MKTALTLLLTFLVLVSAPLALSIQVPRQVDPNNAPSDPVYGQGLYLFYGSIVVALTGGNYSAARHLVSQTPFLHIPPEISDAVKSFNKLVNSTANLFIVIKAQLDNASTYLSTGRVELARGNLTAAISNMRSANQTLTQLFGAEPQLAALTGIPSSLLLQKLEPLEGIYTSDASLANRLLRVITGLAKLDVTEVTLSASPGTIKIGSNVTVSGTLSGPSGSPLVSRYVTVYFEGQPLGKVLTGAAGAFSGEFATPFYYQKNATLFASFLATGNDSLVYAPSTSLSVFVEVTFATPSVSVSVPRSVLAGQALGVEGDLSLAGVPLPGYSVTLSGFKASALGPNEVASTLSGSNGSFSLSLVPPSGLNGGLYPLTLTTKGNGTTGPLSLLITVTVIKESLSVSSSTPVIAIAGFPITISGSAVANGTGLSGATVVNTSPGPQVETNTSKTGSFTFTVTPPIDTPNGGWGYAVGVYPTQSWISSANVQVNVFVVNPVVLLLPASSVGLLVLVVRRRRPPDMAPVLEPLGAAPVASGEQRPVPLTGLPAIYSHAAELVGRGTGVALQPQMTVREYLAEVQGKFKGFDHFRLISVALETHLYGGGVTPKDEGRAESELAALRGELEA